MPSLQPVSPRDLRRYLERTHSAVEIGQRGSHVRMLLPNGRSVTIPADQGGSPVTTVLLRRLAEDLCVDFSRLSAHLGINPHNAASGPSMGRPVAKVPLRDITRGIINAADGLMLAGKIPEASRPDLTNILTTMHRIRREAAPEVT